MLLVVLTGNIAMVSAQLNYTVGFAKDNEKVRRVHDYERIVSLQLNVEDVGSDELKDYTLSVEADLAKTTIPQADYSIIKDIVGVPLKDTKGKSLRIILQADSGENKQVKNLILVLKLIVKKKDGDKTIEDDAANNKAKIKEIKVTIEPADAPLENYRYLGYLGTNFDLVDGIEAKKLYFATNIFIPAQNKLGVHLGVYGNRTMTKYDTAENVTFISRRSFYKPDSIIVSTDSGRKVRTQISDNIGAFFAPVIPIYKEGDLKFYYAPNFEFVWRRNRVETDFSNNTTIRNDTIENRYPSNTPFPLVSPLNVKASMNIYDVYLGVLGILMRYENQEISIRAQAAFGWNYHYTPVGNLSSDDLVYQRSGNTYFQARLWLTEPTTGFTLGVETSHVMGKYTEGPYAGYSKAKPYWNVTLSKAFNLKSLASLLKPLSNR